MKRSIVASGYWRRTAVNVGVSKRVSPISFGLMNRQRISRALHRRGPRRLFGRRQLAVVEGAIEPVLPIQFAVATGGDNPSVIKYEDLGGVANGREAVRD